MERKGKEIDHSPIPVQVASYQQLSRNELPTAVRNELVVLIEQEISPLEERLRSQLPEVVRIIQRKLFQLFQESDQADAATCAQHDQQPDTSDGTGANQWNERFPDQQPWNGVFSDQQYTMGLASIDNEFAAFWPSPLNDSAIDDYNQFDFVPQTLQSSAFERSPDSGYQSIQLRAALEPNTSQSIQGNTAEVNLCPKTLCDRGSYESLT